MDQCLGSSHMDGDQQIPPRLPLLTALFDQHRQQVDRTLQEHVGAFGLFRYLSSQVFAGIFELFFFYVHFFSLPATERAGTATAASTDIFTKRDSTEPGRVAGERCAGGKERRSVAPPHGAEEHARASANRVAGKG